MGSLHEDLLAVALHLSKRADEASHRRAVSTAYYALFHLLITEATLNWKQSRHRNQLARSFEHRLMRAACDDLRKRLEKLKKASHTDTSRGLLVVARAFVQLQDERHSADYDGAKAWTKSDAVVAVASADLAFGVWKRVRKTRQAQDFLLCLFVKKR